MSRTHLGMSAVIWSHGGSVQDADENVLLNSPETVAAVKFLAKLQNDAMTDEIFGWTAASNNQGLIAGELSYILNSISAYRSLQTSVSCPPWRVRPGPSPPATCGRST